MMINYSGDELRHPNLSIDCKEVAFTVNGLEIRIDTSKFPKWLGNTKYIEINGVRFNKE